MRAATASTRPEPVNPQTIGEFNLSLSGLSLGPITKGILDEVLKTETRERLVKALNQAPTDQRALAYLNRFFGKGAAPTAAPASAAPAAAAAAAAAPPTRRADPPVSDPLEMY